MLTVEEMRARPQKNVERWIAAHIIPVRQSLSNSSKPHRHSPSCMHAQQTYPIDFNSQSYPTLLDGTSVQFDVVKGDVPEWSNVFVNKDIHVVGFKEVRIPFRHYPAGR